MKIIFLGSVKFSKAVLESLIKSKKRYITGVIGGKKSNLNSDYADITLVAKSKNIPFFKTFNINNKKTFFWIRSQKPDLIICVGWSKIIKESILKIPRYGVIGYHPSDLPANKGKHPIIWSIFLGLKRIGSTFFLMNKKIDSGKIISKKILINKTNYNSSIIYSKLECLAGSQLKDILNKFFKYKKFKLLRQKKISSNYWRKRSFNDGNIDFRMHSKTILNLVKSLNFPYPGARLFYKKKYIKVNKIKIKSIKDKNIEPGKIVKVIKKKPLIKTADGAIILEEFQPKINFLVGDYI